MGVFRTFTCGGWTYVTSTDDHDWHDIFMISYLVATLPWTLGCLALSPPNATAIKYRKALAGTFFGTLIPLVYFFIQHKVHRVAGGVLRPFSKPHHITLAYSRSANVNQHTQRMLSLSGLLSCWMLHLMQLLQLSSAHLSLLSETRRVQARGMSNGSLCSNIQFTRHIEVHILIYVCRQSEKDKMVETQ